MTFWQKMLSFEGRIGRQDFWVGTLIIWGVSIVVAIALVMVAWQPLMAIAADEGTLENEDPAAVLRLMAPLFGVIAVYILFQLAIIWPSLALCVKRLHDRDQSGWWCMLFVAMQLISWIPLVGLVIWLGVKIWWLVNLGILEGTPGRNRYGAPPNEPETAEVFA